MKISDKIAVVVFLAATALVLSAAFVVEGLPRQVLLLGALIYIFAFIASFMAGRKLSRRLTKLTFNVEEMAAGNFSKKLTARGRDEIAQLTMALNELLTRLQTGIAQDVSKNRDLARAKQDFVSLASHQLRTPLSIIKWYIDFVLSGDAGEVPDYLKKYLQEVYTSNERMIELVNALLDVSRIDVGTFAIDPEPTDIIAKAEAAIGRFDKEIENKGIILERSFDDIPPINLDPRLTRIVFENIISNAVKYTPEGGRIRLAVKKTNKDVLIKISDSGCGITREEKPKIFTKLFRAANVKKIESVGTGLGLYIVKAVIEKSGGKIWFESPSLDLLIDEEQKGRVPANAQGTTFFITIPLKGMKKKKGTRKLTSFTK